MIEHEGEDLMFIREQDVVGFLDNPTTVELVYEG